MQIIYVRATCTGYEVGDSSNITKSSTVKMIPCRKQTQVDNDVPT